MDHNSHDSCSTTTLARGVDMFNRRGSVIAVVIPGLGNAETLTGASVHSDQPSTASDSDSHHHNHKQPDRPDPNHGDWRPVYPRLVSFHDCLSLASAWSLGQPPPWNEHRPTGASQAQSRSEDDPGDGKSNDLLNSCPAFRNELGVESVRRVALSRATRDAVVDVRSTETWHREHTAAEAHILEDVSNVYLGGRLCAARQPKCVIEPQDIGSYYYRHCFVGRQHMEMVGMDEDLGPIVVSVVKDLADKGRFVTPIEAKGAMKVPKQTIYRMIIRIGDLKTMRVAISEDVLPESKDGAERVSSRALFRELLEIVCPQLHFSVLRPALQTQKFEELLTKIDEQPIYARYKVGVILCMDGQSTEEQMYNNETSSPAFDEFLEFLGQRVRLKGFDQYKGGLDTKGDTTGAHSVYAEYESHEIMFHVSTLLPYTPQNRQQLARKRHIGNDMVTIVFQEAGALPFSPNTVRSHFQHVFIVVRVSNPCTENVSYSVAVCRALDVPSFGPPIPRGATFNKCAYFHDWLLTKIINAENAVHRSKKFAAMAARTRREALRDLVENHGGPVNEGPARIASRLLGGSVKRRERTVPLKPQLVSPLRGALSWLVDVHDHSLNLRVSCVLGLSFDALVLLERPTGVPIFITPTHSIIGWIANPETGLKIYYDHGDMLLVRCCVAEGSAEIELATLLERLSNVTKGEEAREVMVRRSRLESWGFHIQDEGVVTDVEMYQTAWKAGLRQGSRIVEIEGFALATLSMERICDLLNEKEALRLLLIAPASDGSPRRGCEDPNCAAMRGTQDCMLTPDAFARQPITYGDMLRLRARDLDTSPHSSPLSNLSNDGSFSFITKHAPRYEGAHHTNQIRPKNSLGTTNNNGASVSDGLSQLLHAPKLNRAFSDEFLRLGRSQDGEMNPLVGEVDRLKGELSRAQLHIEKLVHENRRLEEALAKEKHAHEVTRKEM
ncbi:unnamed protein product, partial [Mesorhabditis belari]|uniref:Rap-GAP domain-containing protein n=1 Tax=Mesorhabditis belari TaxID=2138241 RepID=A0AAF3J748_9BILA